jgi:hypothetical protein
LLLTGHQPNYLPYPGFFEKIARADLFLIVDNVQFVKRGPFGWIHRNKIRTPDGWNWLSLDCLTKGKYHQNINEVLLKAQSPCLKKHWRSIEINYARAPFFSDYAPFFREIYLEKKWTHLCELNIALIKTCLQILDISTPLKRSSKLNIQGKASELIARMCQVTGASSYLSGSHGKDYLDLDFLKKEGVDILFQDFPALQYTQCWPGPFQENLCILDLLFNCGKNAKKLLLTQKRNEKL